MKKIILLLIMFAFISCSRSYTGYAVKTHRNKTEVKAKKFSSRSKCVRKGQKMRKKQKRRRTHNKNYGI